MKAPKFQPYKGLDFGFRNLKSVADFSTGTKPIYDNENYDLDNDGKFKATKVLRLRSNKLQLISGLSDALEAAITKYQHIKWLDLSFNELTAVNGDLEQVNFLSEIFIRANSYMWQISCEFEYLVLSLNES